MFWWRRLSSSSSEDVLKTSLRRLDKDEYICLSHTSSEDVFKTSLRRLKKDQYIFLGNASSRRLQDIFKTSWKVVFKTFSKRIIKLKELRNCILCIFRAWSLFCSWRIYISLHFLPLLFKNLAFLFFCGLCLLSVLCWTQSHL